MGNPQGECGTCGEGVDGFCPESRRPCRHHCNCIWTHGACDWCGQEFCGDCEDYHPEGIHTAPDLAPAPLVPASR